MPNLDGLASSLFAHSPKARIAGLGGWEFLEQVHKLCEHIEGFLKDSDTALAREKLLYSLISSPEACASEIGTFSCIRYRPLVQTKYALQDLLHCYEEVSKVSVTFLTG